MSQADKWDQRFRGTRQPDAPALVLESNLHLLPAGGLALDLACGIASNGLLLAERGLQTSLWDISSVALELQRQWARQRQLEITTLQRDCARDPPTSEQFDVICVAHFLHRPLCPIVYTALKPGGLLFYQTFCNDKIDPAGPSSPEFLLQPGELPELFRQLRVRFYREDGRCGDLQLGERNRALLVAQKPVG
ncbi:MAG: class I SAM-dependent methyltransferase [Gammaproteobacteria bacterium]|nr:class I SAM-dependent methyltransferase [Gammaproteobacteria bacterium]